MDTKLKIKIEMRCLWTTTECSGGVHGGDAAATGDWRDYTFDDIKFAHLCVQNASSACLEVIIQLEMKRWLVNGS